MEAVHNKYGTDKQLDEYRRAKGDDSIIQIQMWYRRAWEYQGVGVRKALNIILQGMLRWQRCKLMIFLLGIKEELFIMEDCWHHPRGKVVGGKVIGYMVV